METPNVELKNVKMFRGMEGYGLNADVWINGIKYLFVMDSGDGGCISYEENITAKNPELVVANIKLMDDYIASLPPDNYHGKLYPISRDTFINNVLIKQEEAKAIAKAQAKHEKKKQALYSHALVIGDPAKTAYRYIDFKRPLSAVPIIQLKANVARVLNKELQPNEQILNTNFKIEDGNVIFI